jgi:hypothetical protein
MDYFRWPRYLNERAGLEVVDLVGVRHPGASALADVVASCRRPLQA